MNWPTATLNECVEILNLEHLNIINTLTVLMTGRDVPPRLHRARLFLRFFVYKESVWGEIFESKILHLICYIRRHLRKRSQRTFPKLS